MAIFGKVVLPQAPEYTVLVLIRETNNWDVFLNYFFGVHCIVAFLIGLTLNPLVVYYHCKQDKSLATTLFLVISSMDLVRSLCSPVILTHLLLSPDLPPYVTLNYRGWEGYVFALFTLLMEVEVVLLVILCTVRYVGVRYPLSPYHRTLFWVTMVTVGARILLFLGFLLNTLLNTPHMLQRPSMAVFTMDGSFFDYEAEGIQLFRIYIRNAAKILVLLFGVAVSVLTIKYFKKSLKRSGSQQAAERNRRSVATITVMNVFNVFLVAMILGHGVNAVATRTKSKFTTAHSFWIFSTVHALPLTQAAFNTVTFVCVSSSFQGFWRKMWGRAKTRVLGNEFGLSEANR